MVAIIGALGITTCGGPGRTLGYPCAYMVLAVLVVVAIIIMFVDSDAFVGLKQAVAGDLVGAWRFTPVGQRWGHIRPIHPTLRRRPGVRAQKSGGLKSSS